MSVSESKRFEVINRQSKSGSRVSVLLASANCYKDRLNTLQKTEWNAYYALWFVFLSSTYFMLVGSGPLLTEFGEVMGGLGWDLWAVRSLRATLFSLLAFAFYSIVYDFYFRSFYKINYESLVNARTLFEYYLHLAIYNAYEAPEDLSLDVPALKYHCTPKDLDAHLSRSSVIAGVFLDFVQTVTSHRPNTQSDRNAKHVRITSPEDLIKESCLNQNKESGFKITNDFVPYMLMQQSKNYSSSAIFLGRRRVVRNFIILVIILVCVTGFFSPVKNAKHNDNIIIEVPRNAIR